MHHWGLAKDCSHIMPVTQEVGERGAVFFYPRVSNSVQRTMKRPSRGTCPGHFVDADSVKTTVGAIIPQPEHGRVVAYVSSCSGGSQNNCCTNGNSCVFGNPFRTFPKGLARIKVCCLGRIRVPAKPRLSREKWSDGRNN